MSNIMFSIIVPVYNVQNYLQICINSILSQSCKNFELILIDDGSSDSSGEICDKFSAKHNNVTVIHQKNGGLSSARNTGLDIAIGEYVIFVDSDDYWDDTLALENIQKNIEETKADVLLFPLKHYYEEENRFSCLKNLKADRKIVTDADVNIATAYLLEHNIYKACAWNKVTRKKIIDIHNMRFEEGRLSEDMDWCGNLLLYARRFDFYDNPFYIYRQQRKGSITTTGTERLVSDKLYMCQKGFQQATELQDTEKSKLLLSYYAYEYAVLLGISGNLKNPVLLNKIQNLQPILKYDISRKVRKVKLLKKIIGFSFTRKALCFFVKTKSRKGWK